MPVLLYLLLAAQTSHLPKPLKDHGQWRPIRLAGVLTHGSGRQIAITFDACPTAKGKPGYDPSVIEVMRKERVPATIFMSGEWVEAHRDIAKDLAADPLFEIGNHGYAHRHMDRLSEKQDRSELAHGQQVIRTIAGVTPRVWRPPYGEVNTAAVRAAKHLGLATVDFSVASGDPDPYISVKHMIKVLSQAPGGSIIVFHVNGNGVHTSQVLPGVIKNLRERGFKFVQVSTLLHLQTKEVARAKRP